MIVLSPKDTFCDERGKIETISEGECWVEINRFTSQAGMKRGGHYHKSTREMIFLLDGRVKLEITDLRTNKRSDVMLEPDHGVIIEPYEMHTAEIITRSVWLAFLSKRYERNDPDVFTEV